MREEARLMQQRPIETPYGVFESILAAACYTNKSTSRIHYRIKHGKPGWRYI